MSLFPAVWHNPPFTLSTLPANFEVGALTWNEVEVEVAARGVLVTTGAVTRQPELERSTVGGPVSIDCADRDDGLARSLVLVHYRTIVGREFRRVVVHIQQSHEYRTGTSPGRNAYIVTSTFTAFVKPPYFFMAVIPQQSP